MRIDHDEVFAKVEEYIMSGELSETVTSVKIHYNSSS